MIFTCPNHCPLISIHSEIHQGQSREEAGKQCIVLVSNNFLVHMCIGIGIMIKIIVTAVSKLK